MIAATEPLRAEHRELLPHIEGLRALADDVGVVPYGALRPRLAGAYAFLSGQLIPHALAEDEVLYPAVARAMGAPQATATMSRDHVAVGELVAELSGLVAGNGEPRPETTTALRRVLYGLHALVRTHFAKEEEIYLPLLDRALTLAEATSLFATMERAAARIKAAR